MNDQVRIYFQKMRDFKKKTGKPRKRYLQNVKKDLIKVKISSQWNSMERYTIMIIKCRGS